MSDRNASDYCPVEKITPNVTVLLVCRKLVFVSTLQIYVSMSLLTDYISLCSSCILWTSFTILLFSSLMSWIIFDICSLYIYISVMFLTFWKLLYCDTGVTWQNLGLIHCCSGIKKKMITSLLGKALVFFGSFYQVDSWYIKTKLLILISYGNQCGIEPDLTHP